MSETWRWRDAIAATVRLQTHETERQVLFLVLQLPFLDASLAARLIGRKGPTAIYRSLAMLQSTGLLAAIRPPLQSGHSPSLFYLTDLGLATLALDRDCEPVDLAGRNGVRRVDLRRLLLGLPYLRATYAMLGALAGPVGEQVELLVWERPWRRRFWRPTAKVPLTLGVPAGVTLRRGSETQTVLLFPDVGTVPLRAYREKVQRLFAYRRARGNLPPLVIATGDEGRAGAWVRLLGDVQRRESEAPLDVSVATWVELQVSPLTLGGGSRVEPTPERTPPAGQRDTRGAPLRPRRPSGALPRIVGEDPGQGENDPAVRAAVELTPAERVMLALIGQHPFLPTRRLATLVGATSAVTLRRRNFLVARGLLRLVESGELRPELADAELVELTVPGLTLVAAQLGLSLAGAVRWSGLAGGGPSAPIGARRKLISQLAHTLGADAVFVSLVATARRSAGRGGDDRLIEWRNAASCSRRHLRPDGYGIYRHDGHLYGFFLEYDRGTMSARDYRQKLDAYYEFWTSGRFELDYDGFPTILVVAISNAAEERLARYLCTAGIGRGVLLPALLTCQWRIERDPSNPDGLLGRIWREPQADFATRRFWPLGQSPSATGVSASRSNESPPGRSEYYLGLTTITQDGGDLLAFEQGRAVLQNSALKRPLRHDASATDRVAEVLKLSAGERDLPLRCAEGQALLCTPEAQVAVEITAAPAGHQLITSDPHEIAALEREASPTLLAKFYCSGRSTPSRDGANGVVSPSPRANADGVGSDVDGADDSGGVPWR